MASWFPAALYDTSWIDAFDPLLSARANTGLLPSISPRCHSYLKPSFVQVSVMLMKVDSASVAADSLPKEQSICF